MVRPGAPSRQAIEELASGSWRFVNRQPGSGTRLLMDHLLQQAGVRPEAIEGYFARTEHTHVAVAAAVASGAADVGLGIEAAAREFGLDFRPLVDEDYYLVCLKDALDTPAVGQLRATLASPAWAQALQSLPGYGVQRPGEVLSLTRALPWWPYRRPKARSTAGPDASFDPTALRRAAPLGRRIAASRSAAAAAGSVPRCDDHDRLNVDGRRVVTLASAVSTMTGSERHHDAARCGKAKNNE